MNIPGNPLLLVSDAKDLNPKHFRAGQYYRFAGHSLGALLLLVAEDGKPSWLMSYRIFRRPAQ